MIDDTTQNLFIKREDKKRAIRRAAKLQRERDMEEFGVSPKKKQEGDDPSCYKNNISNWIKEYAEENRNTLVVGVSGGVDSAVVCTKRQ